MIAAVGLVFSIECGFKDFVSLEVSVSHSVNFPQLVLWDPEACGCDRVV